MKKFFIFGILAYGLISIDFLDDDDIVFVPSALPEAGLDIGSDTDAGYQSLSVCPEGMLRITGEYCPLVDEACLKWLDTDLSQSSNGGMGPLRCAKFKSPTKCLSKNKVYKDFCMDKFEFPNHEGALPEVGRTFLQAQTICENVGKRLCTDSEWTFACEGPDMHPYPYGDGYERNEDTCNTHYLPMPVGTPKSKWKDYYKAEPSGANSGCASPFGIYDMSGNVDEHVVNESGHPYKSGLKGGYWTYLVRTRCRPMTVAHNETYAYYQNGFRCCSSIIVNE